MIATRTFVASASAVSSVADSAPKRAASGDAAIGASVPS